jgi:hypothetical protein
MHCSKITAIGALMVTAVAVSTIDTARADGGFNTSITGYGTVGGTFTSDGDYKYTHDVSEFKGAGSNFDVALDTRIGVQAVVDFSSSISVTVQELARRRGNEDFSLGTEWAFVQYAATSDLKLRLGRVVLATFLESDSRNVGYAQPWFNAPNDLYAAEPYFNVDGGQVLWHRNIGPVGIDLQAAYGSTSQTFSIQGSTLTESSKNVFNASLAVTYKDLLFRVAETKIPLPTTLPLGPTTVLNYVNHDKFISAAFQYDNGKALVMSEWVKRSENDAPILGIPLGSSTQWYAAGGWHFGKFLPLVMYEKYKSDTTLFSPEGNWSTVSADLRFDVARNIALKAEVSRPQVSNGFYIQNANYTSSQRVNVYSLGADFVF